MERKLLSLPSFFVLLLVAGIAFLATPVEDVQAQTAPTVSSVERVTMTPTGADMTTQLTAGGAKDLFIIKFNTPINVASADASIKFDAADLKVTVTDTSAAATSASNELVPSRITVKPIATTAATPLPAAPAVNQWFAVNLAVPTNGTGTITLLVKGTTAGGAFQAANAGVWATAADQPASGADHIVHYDTYDGDAPTVVITAGAGATGTGTGATQVITVTGGTGTADGFQLEFQFSEPLGTATGADFVDTDVSIVTTPATGLDETSRVARVTAKPGAPEATPTFIVAIDPATGATKVTVGVKDEAVADANDNKLSPAATKDVTINSRPTVTIAWVNAPPAEIPDTTSEIDVRFSLSAIPSTSANDDFQERDITVTNGTLKAGSWRRELLAVLDTAGGEMARYVAIVSLPAVAERQTPLTIKVAADSFKAGGLGNVESNTLSVPVEVTAPDPGSTGPPAEMTGDGTALTGGDVGFALPTASIAANGFVVLAKSPTDAGFTSALETEIDIKDSVWQDLRHFLVTTEGGTIDLINPDYGSPVKSVVISEVMWGNDNGLPDATDSQWIELYNTTDAAIPLAGWKLKFSTKSYGDPMFTGDAAKAATGAPNGAVTTVASPVVDKLSTWRRVGSVWLWSITDEAGGSYGQSGKSTPNSATSPGTPSELISMQRKINYDTVNPTTRHDANDAVKNRNAELGGIPGTDAGNWEASPEHGYLLTYRKGTPGAKPAIKSHDQTPVAGSSVVFNEIANRSDKKYEWIELYNKSGSAKTINNWQLSVVSVIATDEGRKDRPLLTFTVGPNGDDITVPAKGYLLIVNTDPRNTPLEGGYDVGRPGNSARQNAAGTGDNPARLYYVSDTLDIPEKDFLLILRNAKDKLGKPDNIEDIAGNNPSFPSPDDSTEVWPLRVWNLGATDDLGQKNDKTWVRDQGKAVFNGDEWKDSGGFTGVGIDRKYKSSDAYTSGTPGYANNAVQNEVKTDGLTEANPVIISEIMFGAGNGRVPQWIELYNPSHTQAVNLKSWKLEIYNYHGDDALEINKYADLTLPEVRIQPNQTVLIVSTTGRSSGSDEFPDDRIINVWSNTDWRDELQMTDRRDAILSSMGFHLRLSDSKKTLVDDVGNIAANKRSDNEPSWKLPGGNYDGTKRSSMVRDIAGSANDGKTADAWRDAVNVNSEKIKADDLYYGDEEDVGTPGYTPGGVLPVQLSSFYSVRNDAGAVIITWATESELDNAGFNILRSTSRSGEFTKINAQLIPGAGTTGEKSAYTWTDTSAKPNVLYFYQIEDVSLDGAHRTLRTTRLRGHVGAHGKLTTMWGNLKSRE